MKRRCLELHTVYDISLSTGYKGGLSNGEGAVDDAFLQDWFETNKYSSVPDVNGSDGLKASDLSATFNYKSYADAETAKNAVLSTDTINWIASNSESAQYTWNAGQLKIDMMFADQTAYDAYLTGIKTGGKRAFKFVGVSTSTVSS